MNETLKPAKAGFLSLSPDNKINANKKRPYLPPLLQRKPTMALNSEKLASVEKAKDAFLAKLGDRKTNTEGKTYSFTCGFSSDSIRSLGYNIAKTPEEAIANALKVVQASSKRPTRVLIQAGEDKSEPGMSSFTVAMFDDPTYSTNL